MTDLSERFRTRILETLTLIASESAQRRYQASVPQVSVPAELFNQWDDFYYPDDEKFRDAFSAEELRVLDQFDDLIKEIAEQTPLDLPKLEVFMSTGAWRQLSQGAERALRRIRGSS